ncbi:taste receptor type 2 member 8-like [Halichoerus grypus]|uniref:taste receptor type 2 member 8-like n=1 Tax=Halichoerus grypus TaxID=9711 RepID=UPI001659982C|nr:taste receptor type 2 member 8-like [Halichoerus grypus]
MASTFKNVLMMTFAGEFIMGLLGNGFIILVNYIDWIRSWKFFLIDFILTCLALSRIFLLCVTMLGIGVDIICEEIWYNDNQLMTFEILWTGSNYFRATCTACLSVFYSLKIANFSNPIFFWIKQRIHSLLLIIVLGVVFFFCLSLLFKDTVFKNLIKTRVNTESNRTSNFAVRKYDLLTSNIVLNITFIIPFGVSLASFVLLIDSLWNHARRRKGTGSGDLITKAHVQAMKSVISFLLFFFMYYSSNVIIYLAYISLDSLVAKKFATMLVFSYPSGHPFLLILWNSKLKQASLCVLRKLRWCKNLRKPTCP